MRRLVPASLTAVALAAGSLTMVTLAPPADAALGASCAKLVSPPPVTINKVLTSKATVSVCLPVAVTGGSGKSVTQIGIKVNGKTVTISKTTWAGGKGTTTQTVTYAALKTLGKCAKGTTRIQSISTVTAGTGVAFKSLPKGRKGKAVVCVTSKSSATLEPGTKYVF